jgi:hypothetical protein
MELLESSMGEIAYSSVTDIISSERKPVVAKNVLRAEKRQGSPSSPLRTVVAATTGDLPSMPIVNGLLSNRNGPSTSIVAMKGPAMFLGSRHESEQVPPQPYSKLKVRS